MADNHFFPRLFSTLKVGERILRNRVVLAATLTNYGVGHRVTDRWINFLAERAKGGSGMIVTEIVAVDAGSERVSASALRIRGDRRRSLVGYPSQRGSL